VEGRGASRLRGVLSLLLLTLLWGTTFPEIKVVVSLVGYSYYVALRFLLASAMLTPLVAGRRERLTAAARPGVVLGALFLGGITLQGMGMQYTSSSNAAFVTGLSIVIVYVLEVLAGRERLGLRLATAVALATSGLYLLSVTDGLEFSVGDLIVLAGAFFWALHIIFTGMYSRKYSLDGLLYVQNVVTALGGLALTALSPPAPPNLLAVAAPHILYLSTVCTILAGFLQLYGQQRVRNVEAAVIYLMEPVFAALSSYFILGEVMTVRQLAGACLILASLAIVSVKG